MEKRQKRGRIDSDYNCWDCGKSTLKNNEYYMLKKKLWKSICPADPEGILCLNCAEIKLGRPLTLFDFTACLANLDCFQSCPEIAKRFGNQKITMFALSISEKI